MGLHDPTVYERGLEFWPYRDSLAFVLKHVVGSAPRGGSVLELMCGTGYTLRKIMERGRLDLALIGVDIDDNFLKHGRAKYPHVELVQGDVRTWQLSSGEKYDVVLCLGALHHVRFDEQECAIQNIASLVKPNGFGIISDAHIREHVNETERRLAAAELGYEYARETVINGAPPAVVEATLEIMANDMLLRGEFKVPVGRREEAYRRNFGSVIVHRTWPAEDLGYGDYVHICSQPHNVAM